MQRQTAQTSGKSTLSGVLGADFFGDQDTRAACDDFLLLDWQATAQQRWHAVLDFQRRHQARLVLAGGLLPPESHPCDQRGEIERLEQLADQHSLRFPKTVFDHQMTVRTGDRWLAKDPVQSGGMGVSWATSSSDHSTKMIQRFIPGKRFGWVGLVYGDHVDALGLSRSLVHRGQNRPFLYGGSVGPVHCDDFPESACCALANSEARHRGYRGLINLDLVRDQQGHWWLLEINARPSASCEVLELAMHSSGILKEHDSLMHRHCVAMDGEVAPPIRADSSPRLRPWLKRIVYARQTGVLDLAEAQHQLHLIQQAVPPSVQIKLADQPSNSTIVRRGEPLATLLIGGIEEASCHRFVRKAVTVLSQCVRRTMNPASNGL